MQHSQTYHIDRKEVELDKAIGVIEKLSFVRRESEKGSPSYSALVEQNLI